jgi:hypothetical protein
MTEQEGPNAERSLKAHNGVQKDLPSYKALHEGGG